MNMLQSFICTLMCEQCVFSTQITWEAFLPEGCGDLVDSRYLIDLDALCVCTSAGGIFLFNGDDGLVEEVGEVEGGIAGAEWSPDEELLVLLTRGAKLIVMTKVGYCLRLYLRHPSEICAL